MICNVPELESAQQGTTLYLDLQLLIMLTRGAITHWNDTRIVRLNPALKDVGRKLVLVTLEEGQDEVTEVLNDIFVEFAKKKSFNFTNPDSGPEIRSEDSYSKVRYASISALFFPYVSATLSRLLRAAGSCGPKHV